MLTYQKARSTETAHLTSTVVVRLRELLLDEAQTQAAQHAAHSHAVAQLRDLTDPDSVLEREIAEVGALRAEEALAEIEHALERLEAGTYGWCESCGNAVPIERLEAIPSARACVACSVRRPGVR